MTDSSHSRRVHLEGARKEALATSRSRLVVTSVLFAVAFAVISGRLVELAVFEDPQARATATAFSSPPAYRPPRFTLIPVISWTPAMPRGASSLFFPR